MVRMRRNNIRSLFLVVLVLSLMPGCASQQAGRKAAVKLPVSSRNEVTGRLVQHFQAWHATPYRAGGMDKTGVDCSGFVCVTYRQLFDIQLPRTAEKLARAGIQIPVSQLRPGDLVLFKTGWKDNHVGIYLENEVFIHASTSRGVMLSGLNEAYWQQHFWQARRIFN